MDGYSGRISGRPSGVYASSLRKRLLAVYLLTIESMQPAEMPKNNRGRPSFLKSRRSSRQLGWGTMATFKPSASRMRPITAAPKEGWST